jgi:alpha-amylase/alpha-mannosidase (GH57 family)
MWLPETAVDVATLEVLAEHGIKFTILAQRQALRVRKIDAKEWMDVRVGRIDPTMAYLCRLPSGRSMSIFFYDGPISLAVAFEKLLNKGEDFANRLVGGYSEHRQRPQLLNIATDGESYGHHHKFGDMALAYALNYVESKGMAKLTNYGEYLEKHPPTHEVEIAENTSWSCIHGIERWRSNCGCCSGMHPGWNQEWRPPLRNALDWLRDQLIYVCESKAKEYLRNLWAARDDYVDVLLNRSQQNVDQFIEAHAIKNLKREEKITVLKLLEIQKNAMLMYTSCGWYFDELSGLETVQVIQYAGRAIQLSGVIFNVGLEEGFLERLLHAKSNLPEYKDTAEIYGKYVKSSMIELKKVGVHYAVSSLFEEYHKSTGIYCYGVDKEDYQKVQAGKVKLAIGKIRIASEITWESECLVFCVLYLGNHDFNGGVHTFLSDEEYLSMKDIILKAFERGAFASIVRLLDKYFGMHNYSLKDLFKDEQRKILNLVFSTTMEEFEAAYRLMYENNRILMSYIQDTGIPVPRVFHTAVEFALNCDLRKTFEDEVDAVKIQSIIAEMEKWNVPVDVLNLEFLIRRRVGKMLEDLYHNTEDIFLLQKVKGALLVLSLLPFDVNLWHVQNIYYKIAKTAYKEYQKEERAGNKDRHYWIEEFKQIGESLNFNVQAVLPNN